MARPGPPIPWACRPVAERNPVAGNPTETRKDMISVFDTFTEAEGCPPLSPPFAPSPAAPGAGARRGRAGGAR
ncbi:hypothetical protein GCM10018953_40550 [Streptosporangium nondiastaticum]